LGSKGYPGRGISSVRREKAGKSSHLPRSFLSSITPQHVVKTRHHRGKKSSSQGTHQILWKVPKGVWMPESRPRGKKDGLTKRNQTEEHPEVHERLTDKNGGGFQKLPGFLGVEGSQAKKRLKRGGRKERTLRHLKEGGDWGCAFRGKGGAPRSIDGKNTKRKDLEHLRGRSEAERGKDASEGGEGKKDDRIR